MKQKCGYAVEEVPEHSSHAPCPVINQIVIQFHDRPDILDSVALQKMLELPPCHRASHVLSGCGARLSARLIHFFQVSLSQKIARVSNEDAFKTFCNICKSPAVMLPAGTEAEPDQSAVISADAMQLEAVEPAFYGFAPACDTFCNFMGRNIAVFTYRNRN